MRESRGIVLAALLSSSALHCKLDSAGLGNETTIVDSGGEVLIDTAQDTPAGCANAMLDGDESDIDCGGTCSKCGVGKKCRAASDCAGADCVAGRCTAAASCSNKTRDGDETDSDCGGSCPQCSDGAACLKAGDCKSGLCTDNMCVSAACNDSMQNGKETDVDCGGGTCSPCATGKICVVNGDCASSWCDVGICQHPRTCKHLHDLNPALPSGVYTIDPDATGTTIAAFSAYCDMTTDGGGWTFFAHVDNKYAAGRLFETDAGIYRPDRMDDGTTYSRGRSILPWVPHTMMMVALDNADAAAAAVAKKILFVQYAPGADGFNRGPLPCFGLKDSFAYRTALSGAFTSGGTTNGCGGNDWYLRTAGNAQYLTFFDYTAVGNAWGGGMGGDDSLNHDGWWYVR
jgi:hypothetical protein